MGVNERHDCDSSSKIKAIGVATVPVGRLTALSDHGDKGSAISKSMVLEGRLTFDVEVDTGGSFEVRLLDQFYGVEPFKLIGPVNGHMLWDWDAQIHRSIVENQEPVRIEIILYRGKLFSFTCE